VIVRGPGSALTVLGSLDVGMNGFGTLSIEDGATVTNELFATLGTFEGPIGSFEEGVGEAVVTGPGSTWTVNGDLHVGLVGLGRWTLSAGGRVVVNGDLFRGDWSSPDDQPQTIIELSGAGDYPTAAIAVSGEADGFDARVDLVGGFVPARGDTFVIADAAALAQPFGFDLPDPPAGLAWQVLQDAGSMRLRLGIHGDLDGDDAVGIVDLFALFSAWGPCPAPPFDACPGDLDGDGAVGFADMLVLFGLWG
jgi:T5SS/PEP-CTERM-associated repeat protein